MSAPLPLASREVLSMNTTLPIPSTPSTLPPEIRLSIRKVLSQLKSAGLTPLPWRLLSLQYKTKTRVELIPSSYGFTSVLAMLEYMAELGECQITFLVDLGACVESCKGRLVDREEVDLSMLDMSWADTGELPVGAVEGEGIDQQEVVGVREGADLSVQVTEVVSLDTVWFCLQPVEARDKVMEELNIFYTKGEGRRWEVPTIKHCWAGRLMVAVYKTEGFHRVMVKRRLESKNIVCVLYVDFGTVDTVKVKDIRLLHKKFLKLPAQAIEARLWGLKEVEGNEIQVKARLVELVREGNLFGMIGMVMAGVNVGLGVRRRDGAVEVRGRLALWLIDLAGDRPEGEWINKQLVKEGMAEWDIMDLIMCKRKNRGKRFKKIKAKLSKMMLNSNKMINVKDLQSVQCKLLAVVENLETSEEVVNSRDRREEDHDNDGFTGGEQANVVEDVKKLNPNNKVVSAINKIITVEDSSDDEDPLLKFPSTHDCVNPTPLQQHSPQLSQLYWSPPPVLANKAVRLAYNDYGGLVVEMVGTVNVDSESATITL